MYSGPAWWTFARWRCKSISCVPRVASLLRCHISSRQGGEAASLISHVSPTGCRNLRSHSTSSYAALKDVLENVKNGSFGRSLSEDDHKQRSIAGDHWQDTADPFLLVQDDLKVLSENIKGLIISDHPVLSTVAKYFFDLSGKRFRPALVLLMARATRANELAREDPSRPFAEADITDSQRRLAEITEMIHTASIVHDDVIDVSDTRRGIRSVNSNFGNKLAVLAGDFLLARASISLARLRNCEVIELLSTVIEHLVTGEIMQMKPTVGSDQTSFEHYYTKTYYKTASLIARSSQATAVLGGHSPEIIQVAYDYGKNLGLAYQFVDDMLDFVGTQRTLGKPAHADLRLGLATAPVLFATEEFPALRPMIQRQFRETGDVDKAAMMVASSSGVERTRELAASHCQKAIDALSVLAPSNSRTGLENIALRVLTRNR